MKNKVKHESNKPKKNMGFYIALALCITAIGGAAWTTYSSVLDYQTPKEESSAQAESSKPDNAQANKNVSGLEYSKPESKVEASEKNTVTSSIESSTESSEEVSEESSKSEAPESSQEVSETSKKPETKFVKPLDGKIIKKFSPENPIFSKTMGDWRVHEGIDIAADDGEKVRAYSDGIVRSVYNDELWGYSVKIEHTDGITMTYSGLSPTVLVKEGDSISCGDYIGAVFTIPSEIMDEVHLHLTAEKNGNIIDAQAVLEKIS